METELHKAALDYIEQGRVVIPLNGKEPLVAWKRFQEDDEVTAELMNQWFEQFGERITGLGMITGYVRSLAVLDLEHDEDPSRFEIPPTAVSRSGGGGWHFYFDYSEPYGTLGKGSLIPNKIHGDLQADGAYIVVPPSMHPMTGKAYEWVTPLAGFGADLPPVPEWLCKIARERTKKREESTDWKPVIEGAEEGTRHEATVKLAGKLLHHLPGKDWDNVVLPILNLWNQGANNPPLHDSEVESVYRGIAQKQRVQGDEGTTYEAKESSTQHSTRTLLSVSAIMDMPEEERPAFLVHGLIPENGITALSGHPGSGKTWVMLHLAKCIALGEAAFGHIGTKIGKVLIVDEEQGVWEHRRRMEKLGYPKDINIFFFCQNGFKLDNEKDVESLLHTVKEKGIDLVMFDPFAALHSQDENSAEGAQKVMTSLQKFNLIGVTVVFIHHHRKNSANSSGGAQSLRGSSAFSGRLDSHITVEKKSQDRTAEHLAIEHVKSRRGQNMDKFYVGLFQDHDIPGSLIELRVEDAESVATRTKKEEAREDILILLSAGDMSLDAIIDTITTDKKSGGRNVHQALLEMRAKGEVSFTKEGKKHIYHLNETRAVEAEPVF